MPNQDYWSVIVTDVGTSVLEQARNTALAIFERDLVSAITPLGHNFICSFAVFPSGSGEGLDFVAVHWTDNKDPEIIDSHAVEG